MFHCWSASPSKQRGAHGCGKVDGHNKHTKMTVIPEDRTRTNSRKSTEKVEDHYLHR